MTTSVDPIKQITYADAGVDVDEGARAVDAIKAAVATTTRPEVIGGLGGFGSCFSAAALKDMEEPVLVSGTDGVGTKLAIAQLLNRHNTVGEDLVAMCVDDIVPMGAEPLFFLDYVAVGKLKAEAVAEIVGGIAEGCRKSGCALVGGEMAEHPGVMNPDDYDLAGFVVGVVDKPKILGPEKVSEGDIILGLPSSGIHSNGYSLVRKVAIEDKTVEELNQPLEELDGESLADAVLRPTTIMQVDCLLLFVRARLSRLWHTLPVVESPRTLTAHFHLTLMQRLIVVEKLVLHGPFHLLFLTFLTLQICPLMSSIAPSIWALAWL